MNCPKCKEKNDENAEYCWACYFDFVPNTAPSEKSHPGKENQDNKKSWARKYQEEQLNKYWRIAAILPGNPNKAVSYPTNWLGLVAAIGFIASLYYALNHGAFIGILAAIGSIGIGLLGHGFTQEKRKEGWISLSARVLDQEMRYVIGPTNLWNWHIRILCEFTFEGQKYRATPSLFPSTEKGTKFPRYPRGSEYSNELLLTRMKRIIPSGDIHISVNPNDPFDCEIGEERWREIYNEA